MSGGEHQQQQKCCWGKKKKLYVVDDIFARGTSMGGKYHYTRGRLILARYPQANPSTRLPL